MKPFRNSFFALLCSAFLTQHAIALEINGAGSTAAAALYKAWAQEWAGQSGHQMKYAGGGSAAGLKAIREGKVDFGASDVPPTADDMKANRLVTFPVAISGVVPVVNLPGLGRGELQLTGEVLAGILSGRITQWDATPIAALNRGRKLPALPIKRVVREDGSGTTYVLSHYLSKVSETWASELGTDFKLKWSEGTIPVKGTSGMVDTVRETPGAIGYAEYGAVDEAELSFVRLANRQGNYMAPGATSFRAALHGSAWSTTGRFEEMLTDAPGVNAWPITGGTFIVMRRKVSDSARATAVLSLFSYGFAKGDKTAAKQHWIPLPEITQARVVREMTEVRDSQGQPLNWKMTF